MKNKRSVFLATLFFYNQSRKNHFLEKLEQIQPRSCDEKKKKRSEDRFAKALL